MAHLLGHGRVIVTSILNTEDESGNNLHAISELTITESNYIDRFVSYTDINCINDPVEELSEFTYMVGEVVPTTDGVDASRITLTLNNPNRPELTAVVEAVYRISGVDLNFGMYTEGETPSIDVSVTYTKQ